MANENHIADTGKKVRLIDANKLESYFHETKVIEVFPYWAELDCDTKTELCKFGATVKRIVQNHPTAVKEIEELQGEAYDLGVESTLRNHFGLSWHDAAEVRKEVAQIKAAFAWIPVTERLPALNPDGTANAVLVTDGCVQHMAYSINGEWLFAESGEMKEPMFYGVTHWMPLPETPKEDA